VFVNVSNLAWFGDGQAIDQHLQISRLRTLEFERPMVRATNTGATVVIDHRGRITAALPRSTRAVLETDVEGRATITPYAALTARWGLWPWWIGCLVVLLWSLRSEPVLQNKPATDRA
jgi:apolipoprotein N-acyltransferase